MKENKPILSLPDRLGIKQKELAIPTDRYLFLDLDMTLIDEERHLNVPSIKASIKKLEQEGWSVGLNSNTPFEPLRAWMQYFGMNGSFVAEKGGVYYHQGRVVFNEELARQIQSSREAIEQKVESMNVPLLLGNTTDVLRGYPFITMQPGPVVILDAVRKSSINFFIREVTPERHMDVNSELTQALTDTLRPLYQNIPDLEEELNYTSGELLVMPRGQAKSTGVALLMREAKLTQVGMIGDSMNDYLGDIAVHYAVSNATKDFQERAVFVSNLRMAQGCKDIMEKLEK